MCLYVQVHELNFKKILFPIYINKITIRIKVQYLRRIFGGWPSEHSVLCVMEMHEVISELSGIVLTHAGIAGKPPHERRHNSCRDKTKLT